VHQMFGPKGNPTAANLFNIIACLQEHEGVRLRVGSWGSAIPGPQNRGLLAPVERNAGQGDSSKASLEQVRQLVLG
jgi:hypothetical protein